MEHRLQTAPAVSIETHRGRLPCLVCSRIYRDHRLIWLAMLAKMGRTNKEAAMAATPHPSRSHTDDVQRFTYATSRWDARLYDIRRTDNGTLSGAETTVRQTVYAAHGDEDFDRAEMETTTFGREVFARLYSNVEKLEQPVGPGWVTRAHSILDDIDGFETLHREIDGDPDLAALATAAMLEDVAGPLEALIEESDEQEQKGGQPSSSSAAGLPGTDDKVRAKLRAAIKTARRAVGDAREGLAGLAPGLGTTPPAHEQASPDRMHLAERLRDDDRLRDIIRKAGRMQRIAAAAKPSRSEGVEEVYDVTRGNNVARLLPSEITKVAHPAMRALLLRDLAQRSAMQYALRSSKPMGRGPLIALLDISGSMAGEPHDWARAIGLALAGAARRDKRAATIADFNGRIARARRIDKDGSSRDLQTGRQFASLTDALLDIATTGVAGGTSFDRALGWAADRVVEHDDKDDAKADLVIVTDGCDRVTEQTAKQLEALQAQTGLRIFAMTINGGAIDSNLAEIADEIVNLDSTEDLGETVAKAGWSR